MARPSRTYRKVEPALWHSDSFRKLSAGRPCAQTLWLYLLTGPRTIAIPGVVVARPAVMADDLRWPRRAFDVCMAEIVAAGMAEVDMEAGLVVLTNALIHDGKPRDTAYPNSGNAIKSWVTALLGIRRCALRDALVETLRRFTSMCGDEMSKAFADSMGMPSPMASARRPHAIPDGVPDAIPDPVGTQDQEQEQEKEREAPAAPAPLSLVPPEPAGPDTAAVLWARQNEHRTGAGLRALKLTAVARKAIAARLKDYTPDDLASVVDEDAASARRTGDWQWFNGETNWRAANVARTYGRIGTQRAGPIGTANHRPSPPPTLPRITIENVT